MQLDMWVLAHINYLFIPSLDHASNENATKRLENSRPLRKIVQQRMVVLHIRYIHLTEYMVQPLHFNFYSAGPV